MMDLINRAAAIEALGEPHPLDYNRISAVEKVRGLPSVDAVPLDKLCKWLAVHGINIPCESCRYFSNEHCTVIGDMDTPCPNKAKDWQRAIKEWMEGLNGTD